MAEIPEEWKLTEEEIKQSWIAVDNKDKASDFKKADHYKVLDYDRAIADAAYKKFERVALPLIEKRAREEGRILGIKQSVIFVKKAFDNPVIADDIERWVIPHGHKAHSEIKKLNRRSP